jgi:DNA-binding MarR family transcriptional regulator
MSRLGILRRFRDLADRRVVWLDLTPAGKDAVDVFLDVRGRMRHRYFDLLSEQDRSDLHRIMSKVDAAAEQAPVPRA